MRGRGERGGRGEREGVEEEEGGMERSVASLSHVMFECLPLLLERRNGLLIEGHQPVGIGRAHV